MNKRGKVITSLSFVLILILVGSILFVSSQSNESNNLIDETQLTDEEQQIVQEIVEDSFGEDVSQKTVNYVKEFVEKRGIAPEEINNVSQVDFGSFPEEI